MSLIVHASCVIRFCSSMRLGLCMTSLLTPTHCLHVQRYACHARSFASYLHLISMCYFSFSPQAMEPQLMSKVRTLRFLFPFLFLCISMSFPSVVTSSVFLCCWLHGAMLISLPRGWVLPWLLLQQCSLLTISTRHHLPLWNHGLI